MKKSLFASIFLVVSLAFASNAVAGDFLADRHAQKGAKCEQCHDKVPPSKIPKMDKCLVCHDGSYEALAKSTEHKHPNPHYTHVGDKECAVCHKGHKQAEFFCNDCHQFNVQLR